MAEIIRSSQKSGKHYLMVFCLTVICYLDSTSATAIDAIAFNKGVERKETPSSIPALQRNWTLGFNAFEYIVPFIGNPIFERKCKSLLWPLAHPCRNLRNSIEQNLLPLCEPQRGWDSLHRFYELAVHERYPQLQAPCHTHDVAIA